MCIISVKIALLHLLYLFHLMYWFVHINVWKRNNELIEMCYLLYDENLKIKNYSLWCKSNNFVARKNNDQQTLRSNTYLFLLTHFWQWHWHLSLRQINNGRTTHELMKQNKLWNIQKWSVKLFFIVKKKIIIKISLTEL